MNELIRPNRKELLFLNLAYNAFYDIDEEIKNDSFWAKDAGYRYLRIREGFSIYSELLDYKPIKLVIKTLKKVRPPMEAEIAGELFPVIRNISLHFPFFKTWDEVWFNKELINWSKEGLTIDKFFKRYEGHTEVKYRYWETEKKRMTYLSIGFPKYYSKGDKIFLKDILKEKEGAMFSYIMMRGIIDTQVKS